MHLKELQIFGFKSFPEKATLKFEPGITVVVGPNGCGKSNVLDAIKWSLGEQSPKSLRGSKMEDIIFNGTENHPALSYAEVSMSFANEDGYLPIEYSEVSISRRLYRSGESQYFINKNLVRLKDIQDLFMGTGIGEATYSFVEQGKIEIFLSYKPEDKRLIFDEASGIVKYKDRRKETMKRLKETDDNLLRLEDILNEVRRQIRYLERQVEKASKYKEIQARLLEVEGKIATLQIDGLEKTSDSFVEQLNALKSQEQDKETRLKEARSTWDELNGKLRALRKNLEDTNAAIVSLGAQIESSQSHIDVYHQRIKELQERNILISQTKNNLEQRLSLQDKRSLEEKQRLSAIDENLLDIQAKIEELKREKSELNKKISEEKKKINDDKTKILELESKRAEFNNSLIEIQTTLSSFLNRKKRLLLDKARLEGFLREKKDQLAIAQENLEAAEAKLKTLKETKEGLLTKNNELNLRKEELRESLIEKEKELVELNSCYEFLKDLRLKYDNFSATKTVTVSFDDEPKDINTMIVSLKGISFNQEGSLYKARIDAKVISLQEYELEEKISAVKADIAAKKGLLEDINRQSQSINEEVSLQGVQIEEEEKNYITAMQEKEGIERETQRFDEESELVEKELENVIAEIQSFESRQKEIETDLGVCETDLTSVQGLLHQSQEEITNGSERIQSIDIEITKKETQTQSLHKEKEALNSKIELLSEERNNILNNAQELDKEKEENIARVASFDKQIKDLTAKIEEDRLKIDDDQKTKHELEKQEQALSTEIENNQASIQEIEKENEEVKTSIYNKKLEAQTIDYQKQKIKDYLRQVYNVEFQALPLDSIDESIEALNESKDKFKKRMDSLGEVNLVAIEEFEELKKRQDFLEKQKEDLITSKENLKKAIQKINKTSKEMFIETFAKIEEEFKKNFRFLFNGGRANLILLDKDNILESGVDIEVQPPGKKLQNVSLLSGGEKALTAISLIFAIFRVRPSPLCVLDEIDAPLDEANVDRFNNLLKEFSAFSQFLLITHNKKTMGSANVLYGVTMQEKGVSKLVSVKFADEKIPS